MSPISSRNSVPPLAPRMIPWKFSMAPVNDPRRWPKSCESSMSRGVEVQLKGRKGAFERVRVGVDGAGEHFLAGSRFARDETGTFVAATRRAVARSDCISSARKIAPAFISTGSAGHSAALWRRSRLNVCNATAAEPILISSERAAISCGCEGISKRNAAAR